MNKKILLGGVILLISLPQAYATEKPFYVGIKTGWVHAQNACESHRLNCENNEIGAGVFAGYTLMPWLAIEAGYDYFGKMKAIYPSLGAPEHDAPYQGEVQGVSMALKSDLALTNDLNLFGKVGMLAWRADVKGQEELFQHRAHDSGLSPLLGAGLEYELSEQWKGRIEYQWINKVGGGDTGGSALNTLYVGLSYYW